MKLSRFLKHFYSFALNYKLLFFLSIFTSVIYVGVQSLFPFLLKSLTDNISDGNFDLSKYAYAFIILAGLDILFKIISQQISDVVVIRSARDLRLAVFKKLQDLDYDFHASKSSGKLISIFKRGESAYIGLFEELNVWTLQIFVAFILIIFLYYNVYPTLIYIAVTVFVINLIITYFTLRSNISRRKAFNKTDDKVTAITVDNMIAFETVKYFAQEKYEQDKLSGVLRIWVDKFIYYVVTFRYIDLFNGGIITAGFVASILIAAHDLTQGNISNGDFVLTISFASLFYPQLRTLVFRFREIAKKYEDLIKYLQILDQEPNIEENIIEEDDKTAKNILQKHVPVKISLKNITFAYNIETKVFDSFNLEIDKQLSVAFVGRSGAGKTTITKLLLRFFDPLEGDIYFNDINIKNISKETLRKLISIVPQEAVLFNDTIKYNISYGKPNSSIQEVKQASKDAFLNDFIESLPNGYNTIVGERGIKLSGGQKQRLAIARAFLEDAPILVFDEATSNLDSESEKQIKQAFWKLAKNKTSIIIAHRLSTVQQADKIIVIDNGKIIEQGTHNELTNASSGLYQQLWDLQTSGSILS